MVVEKFLISMGFSRIRENIEIMAGLIVLSLAMFFIIKISTMVG